MIRIDSDSHFTPLDAFDEVDPKYGEIGPHFEVLPSGRYKVIHKARDPFVPQHIKPLREKGHSASYLDPAPRIDAMAQDGFDMQVLIPNNAPFYYDVDGVLGASVSRSFNRSIARILIGFIPWLVDRLETTYDARAAARENASRRPREGFSNFYFSLGADDSTLPDVVKRIGTNRLMIGSDYPHPDGTFPKTVQMLQSREGLTKQDVDNLLGGTAVEFFGLKQYL